MASGCNGNCESCGMCAGQLVVSQPEVDFLRQLGQNAFLPVARSSADPTPIYLEDSAETPERYGLILQCLEKKGLIELDFTAPLKHADMGAYAGYPIHGSIALTARGQQVLDILEIQGVQEL